MFELLGPIPSDAASDLPPASGQLVSTAAGCTMRGSAHIDQRKPLDEAASAIALVKVGSEMQICIADLTK
jgi:hypothetical protein